MFIDDGLGGGECKETIFLFLVFMIEGSGAEKCEA